MIGGAGDDAFIVDNALDVVTEAVGGGRDTVLTSVSFVFTASSEVELVSFASPTSKTSLSLTGSEAGNILEGNAGRNTLNGMGGNDVLDGNTGNDNLRGGLGNDTFRFDTRASRTNIDRVLDFSSRDDVFNLENKYFTGMKAGALKVGAFHVGNAAHDADDRIIYDKSTGALYFDRDGNGDAAAIHFATVANKATIKFTDFFFV